MNVIRLMGGLGNQLFQYAFGKAMVHNGIAVKYDISQFARRKHREYMLGNFNLNIEFSPYVNARGILDTGANPSYNPDYLKKDGYNCFGYWQHLDYFRHLLPEIEKEVWVKEEAYTDEYVRWRDMITNDRSVGVHIRRDDYLTSNTISPLPLSYYLDAIKLIDGNLYVFSDDIEWCRQHFNKDYFDREINFINLAYYLDFELMKLCKHNIISNSTFSWWAAILNSNPEKMVVTPNIWITKYDRIKRNNFPDDWIKIDV